MEGPVEWGRHQQVAGQREGSQVGLSQRAEEEESVELGGRHLQAPWASPEQMGRLRPREAKMGTHPQSLDLQDQKCLRPIFCPP